MPCGTGNRRALAVTGPLSTICFPVHHKPRLYAQLSPGVAVTLSGPAVASACRRSLRTVV
eukprot:10353-Heterococcus_DN1.PRE.2